MLLRSDMTKIGIVIGTAVLLVGCTSAESLQLYKPDLSGKGSVCTGWQGVQLKPRTAQLLEQSDPNLAANIRKNNLKGRGMGCWE